MSKYSFLDDYSEGCHPKILEALASTNLVQQTAYGNDEYSEQARKLIRKHLGGNNFPIYFVAGGTLANIIIMSSALRSHEAVIAASTGHIVVRETGAIEATGHKIITVVSADGKLTSSDMRTMRTIRIWPNRAWCIYRTRRKQAPYIQRQSCRACQKPAMRTNCYCCWMGQGWA